MSQPPVLLVKFFLQKYFGNTIENLKNTEFSIQTFQNISPYGSENGARIWGNSLLAQKMIKAPDSLRNKETASPSGYS